MRVVVNIHITSCIIMREKHTLNAPRMQQNKTKKSKIKTKTVLNNVEIGISENDACFFVIVFGDPAHHHISKSLNVNSNEKSNSVVINGPTIFTQMTRFKKLRSYNRGSIHFQTTIFNIWG